MPVTIREVAQRAGVCAGTVSLVLNKKPGISESTRRRVEQALKELNYKPNLVAQRLVTRQIRTIGVVYSEHLRSGGVPSGFMMDVFEGIRSVTDSNQSNLILVSVTEEFRENHLGIHMIHRDRLAGVLLIAVDLGSPYIDLVRQSGLPFVDINRRVDDDGASYVVLDYEGAATQGVGHLKDGGYGRIGLLVREGRESIGRDLHAGYRRALGVANVDPKLIGTHDATEAGGRKSMADLLKLGVRGVFVSDNSAARGAIAAAREAGLSVPEEVGVVGMHDYSEPGNGISLTTIRYPTEELGRTGVDTLFRLMENPNLAAQRSVVRTELVAGDSTVGANAASSRRRSRKSGGTR